MFENVFDVLPMSLAPPHYGGMAGVRVGIQQAEVANEARAQRVQVNIPDQLQQVGFLLAKGASGTYIELSFYSFWQREPLLLCEFFSSGQCDADRRLTYAEPFRNSGAGHAKLPYQ